MITKTQTTKMLKVFHFDINGTILGTDSTDDANIEQMACEALARSIITEGNQTYYNKIKSERKDYKKKVYNLINDFPEFKADHDKLVTAFQNGLFKSFLKIVNNEFVDNNSLLVLRTFGKDRDFVADILSQYGLKFVTCNSDELNDVVYNKCHEQGLHIMVTDDYKKWNDNGRKIEFGKYVQYFPNMIQYAFDDNLCMNFEEGVKFFHVNTLHAVLDENYYLNMIYDTLSSF